MKENYRIQELDALRGAAALMIVLFHFSIGRYLPMNFSYLRLANTGVELFFMISGFVIFMTLKRGNNGREFIVNRVSRLYPTYCTVVSLTTLLVIINTAIQHVDSQTVSLMQYLGNMTMFQRYLNVADIDGPYWTMLVEMIFYLFMLGLFYLNLLKKARQIGIIVSIATAIFSQAFLGKPILDSVLFYFPLLPYLPLFVNGIIFYNIYAKEETLNNKKFSIILMVICQIILHSCIRNSGYTTQLEYGCIIILITGIFALFVDNRLLFIVSKPTLFLGKISYPLYLVHQYLSVNFIIPNLMQRMHFRFIPSCFIALIIVIAISFLIAEYVEIPARRIIKTYLLNRRAAGNAKTILQ